MKLTEFSLRNPLAVVVLAAALCVSGWLAYRSMGVTTVPNISFSTVVVSTTWAGADPASVETEVTKPIEEAVRSLDNIDTITSTSNQNLSVVNIQFTTAANDDLTAVDVERAVTGVRSTLPSDAEAPSILKVETSSAPVLTVALSGPQPLDQIQSVATDQVQHAIENVPGVSSVSLAGAQTREVWVKADLSKLQSRGVGLNTLQQALQGEQLEVPAGTLSSATRDVNIRLNALAKRPDDISAIVVAQTAQGPVYVRDVATVSDTIKKVETVNRVDGTPAITLVVSKLKAASSIEVEHDVRQVMADTQPTLPLGMTMNLVVDSARYAEQSFNTIQKTLLEAILCTGLILLLFLHTWRSTLIVLVSIPTSLLTTFAVMGLLGLNLNLLSMLAVTLSVGILVDDSIVVLENVYRHMRLGEPPLLAAVNGRSEIGLAAITITLVDVVVYVPIALLTGLIGQFLRPFALAMACATLTSLVVSFTLAPMLASRFIRKDSRHMKGPWAAFTRLWEAGFEALASLYRWVLRLVLARRGMRWLVIAAGFASLFLGLGLLRTGRIGIDIFPSGDQSEVDVTLVMPSATTLDQTYGAVQEIERRLKTYPEVREVYSNTGTNRNAFFGNSIGGDTSRITALLVPRSQRGKTSDQLGREFRAALGRGIPGAQIRVQLPNAFGFGGFGAQPIQIAIRGPNPDVLNHLLDQMTATVRAVPGAADVNNSNEKVQPELVLNIDRNKAADLGITAQTAAQSLHAAVDGVRDTTFRQPGQDDVDVRLIADDAFRANLDGLSRLPLLSNSGHIVSLSQLGTLVPGTAPTQINHYDEERSVTISASTAGRLPGDVQREIETALSRIAVPAGYSVKYSGQGQQGGQALGTLASALGISVLLMYLLMTLLFRSLTLPLAVLMSLPLAVVGALGAMALTSTPFTLFSVLGVAVLVGLVGKNAILLVDYTDTLRRRGESRLQALLQAGPTRLRPIVMTTLSVIVGLAPVAFGIEEGSELLRTAAVVLSGGLITSTVLTLLFVPAMYTVFDDIQALFGWLAGLFVKPRSLTPEELLFLQPVEALVATNGNGRHAAQFPLVGGRILKVAK